MLINSNLSDYCVKKIIACFSIDMPASKTALLLGLNRNTVNRWYGLFRRAIYGHQSALKDKLVGRVEVDESYFGAKRHRGRQGKLKRGRGTLKQPCLVSLSAKAACTRRSSPTVSD
jgi:transposase